MALLQSTRTFQQGVLSLAPARLNLVNSQTCPFPCLLIPLFLRFLHFLEWTDRLD